jgi:hypothetical protein
MGISYIGNSCANLFNAFVTPVAMESIEWRYYLVYIAMLAQFWLVVFFFFPETRGYGLEQISDLFESDKVLLGKARINQIGNERDSDVQTEKEGLGVQIEQVETVAPETSNLSKT